MQYMTTLTSVSGIILVLVEWMSAAADIMTFLSVLGRILKYINVNSLPLSQLLRRYKSNTKCLYLNIHI